MDSFPAEIIDYILSFIPRYSPLTRRVCRLWAALQRPGYVQPLLQEAKSNLDIPLYFWLLCEAVPEKRLGYSQAEFLLLAAERENLPLLQWCQENWGGNKKNSLLSPELGQIALEKGNLEILDWIIRSPGGLKIWNSQTAARSIIKSPLPEELLLWLEENLVQYRSYYYLAYYAAEKGDLALLKKFYGDYGKNNQEIFSGAVRSGHMNILLWLKSQGCSFGKNSFLAAVERGQLPILKWLVAQRKRSCHIDVLKKAVALRHIQMSKWLVKKCFSRTEVDLYQSIGSKNLTFVQWLYARGKLDKNSSFTMALATRKGQLEILKWLYQEGFPLQSEDYLQAASHGHIAVIEWYESLGIELDRRRILLFALSGCQKEVFKWVFREGLEVNEDILCQCLRYSFFRVDLLSFLLEEPGLQRSPENLLTEKVSRKAAHKGRISVFRFLVEKGCPWNREFCQGIRIKELQEWLAEQK